MTRFTHLVCSVCDRIFPKDQPQTFCPSCKRPLLAVYDLTPLDKNVLVGRNSDMWRYRELLPIENERFIVTLGEGFTPLLPLKRIGRKLGLSDVWFKDESANPTGSFKARGLAMAVSKAHEYGIREMAIPTAGNAGSALAAYGARAGIKTHVFMPEATPKVFQTDCTWFGARVTTVQGSIRDAGQAMGRANLGHWFDVSTLKEPYRIEGKKTMGYELAEQLHWQTPDVILYPTGGGTGLIGIWKAFKEMLALGWISEITTRMVAVQATGCDPIVSAFEAHEADGRPIENPPETIANGLRVPAPFGDRLILEALYESRGTAITISDEEMESGIRELAVGEGFFVAPEGAAVWMALKKLRESGWVKPTDKVVLLNTGSAYKYIENLWK
ncbi:MAG TPA: threonine synthase [Rhodothermales bacterium]|nr:threonine synthase [Rhodothermales bacterium]